MTSGLSFEIQPVAYERIEAEWLRGLQPYIYQQHVYELTRQAITQNETLCIFLVTPTGSGKTLGSYAYAINHQIRAFGVYPTNELIRDQHQSLEPWLDPRQEYRLLKLDSAQLDHWQNALHEKQHAATFEVLMNWRPTILTNPDILFYTFFGLYHGAGGISQRLFSLIGDYPLFIFDEFHLYNIKQMADVAFLVAALHAINPHKGRVFIFASATPELEALSWFKDRLNLHIEVVQSPQSDKPDAHRIAHPLRLTILPADLGHWKGAESLQNYLPDLRAFISQYPQARLVTILDSVAGAIQTADVLKTVFPEEVIGEVHGFSSQQERDTATRCPITVGTSTIEVGIDFKDETGKDILIYEARTASQFIQRFGRLARHAKPLPIPNWAIALVPEYVCNFFVEQIQSSNELSRAQLYELVNQAYQLPQDFAHYLHSHAPAEFHEARFFAQGLFQSDDRQHIIQDLGDAIQALTRQSAGAAYKQNQLYKEMGILAPLLTFRGTGFEVAILDQRSKDPGFPSKRYNLMFVLRRGVFSEIDEAEYIKHLDIYQDRWPEETQRERRYSKLIGSKPDDLLGIYGHFILTDILEKTRKVWFVLDEEEVIGQKGQVTVVSNLGIVTEPETHLRRLNRHLMRKSIVAWFMDCHPNTIRLGRALPPLFEIHELRIHRPGGTLSQQTWSIVFNQDAFFVDSLGWYKQQRENKAIIL